MNLETSNRKNSERNPINLLVGGCQIDKMAEDKSYEIITHPGRFDPESKSSLNKDREQDIVKVNLINNKIKQMPKIKLISYLELN